MTETTVDPRDGHGSRRHRYVADVLGHDSTRMPGLVYRHVLAPTVEAGAMPMQAMLADGDGEPQDGIGTAGPV
jgi:hypothetical protein